MKQSLLWRFILIIVAVSLSALIVRYYPIRFGIDLKGGTSLLYELDLAKFEGQQVDISDIANRVIDVLKKRVDPTAQKNLIWRVVGGKRIQVQMPQADQETKDARKAYNDTWTEITSTNLPQSVVMSAIAPGPQRDAKIAELAPVGTPRNELLTKLAKANDQLKAVQAEVAKLSSATAMTEDLTKRLVEAEGNFRKAKTDLEQTNLDETKLKSLLTAAENDKNVDARAELKNLPVKYPAQKAVLERLIAAHALLKNTGGLGRDDPADLQRMITGSGVLDFRIAVRPGDYLNPGDETADTIARAHQILRERGPGQTIQQRLHWFAVDESGRDNFRPEYYVMDSWAGQPYVLLYDDTAHTLTHDATRKKWSINKSQLTSDPRSGGIALSFGLDPIGADLFGTLTADNLKRPMAILLDDRAISSPTIQSAILGGSGQITFGEVTATHTGAQIRKEAENLRQILDAGSLPAALQREPISVQEISADLGADNITAGQNSSYYAVLAVIIFMVGYYTITGFFADVAVLINLLITMAVMAMLGATLTLPGIAGLVLTLGMAVDANVLINERIREEIHKGASLWMAVRQGYDRVFWTIFDANTTTSLTSIVLIFVGSEEVKGFGVTLLIGLMIHMFTALFVTRTFMLAAIKWGVLRAIDDHSVSEYFREILTATWLRKGHWPFMRVITVTNIDWIGKRHIFWGISAAVTLAGLIAFIARGEDKYDTEFRGGTQVTFQLKNDPVTGKPMTMHRDEVERRVKEIADLKELTAEEKVELADLKTSTRVVAVGTTTADASKFELQTTIADTKTVKIKQRFLDLLAAKFTDVLAVQPQVAIRETESKDITKLRDLGLIAPIKYATLDQVFDGTPITGMPNRDLTDYLGGVAIVMDNISPPQTAAQIADRIRAERVSPLEEKVPNRQFAVIPLMALPKGATAAVPALDNDDRPLTRAVMVAFEPSAPFDANEALWQDKVASTEWHIVQQSLEHGSQFQGVTSFDAVVASQAKIQALIAIALSLLLIVVYVWVRFGGLRYGIGAILSLVHDAIVALAATVLAKYAADTWLGPKLLISDFKIS